MRSTANNPAPCHAQQLRGVELLMQGNPWRLVTTLEIGMLDEHTAALIAAACPSLQHLVVTPQVLLWCNCCSVQVQLCRCCHWTRDGVGQLAMRCWQP